MVTAFNAVVNDVGILVILCLGDIVGSIDLAVGEAEPYGARIVWVHVPGRKVAMPCFKAMLSTCLVAMVAMVAPAVHVLAIDWSLGSSLPGGSSTPCRHTDFLGVGLDEVA